MTSIGFIGAGQMARALAGGLVDAGLVSGERIVAADPSPEALRQFASLVPGARMAADNAQAAADAEVIFLAVKPQHMAVALAEIATAVDDAKLVVSIAAGVTCDAIAKALPAGRLIRVMPNTPCLVRRGASGYCLGRGATKDDADLVGRLLSAVGAAHQVEEKLLDAVTGLSGSGPAFVYMVIEALADGGVLMGLPRQVAASLAAQTVRGAAEMVVATGEHPAVLAANVASPGGTTIAGLSALEEAGLRAALIRAVEAATERSIELGRNGR